MPYFIQIASAYELITKTAFVIRFLHQFYPSYFQNTNLEQHTRVGHLSPVILRPWEPNTAIPLFSLVPSESELDMRFLHITSYLCQNLKKVSVPFLALHGTSDAVTDPEATKRLYEEASSSDKSIKLYKGLLHDLLFEPERDDIIKDIIDWLSRRARI